MDSQSNPVFKHPLIRPAMSGAVLSPAFGLQPEAGTWLMASGNPLELIYDWNPEKTGSFTPTKGDEFPYTGDVTKAQVGKDGLLGFAAENRIPGSEGDPALPNSFSSTNVTPWAASVGGPMGTYFTCGVDTGEAYHMFRRSLDSTSTLANIGGTRMVLAKKGTARYLVIGSGDRTATWDWDTSSWNQERPGVTGGPATEHPSFPGWWWLPVHVDSTSNSFYFDFSPTDVSGMYNPYWDPAGTETVLIAAVMAYTSATPSSEVAEYIKTTGSEVYKPCIEYETKGYENLWKESIGTTASLASIAKSRCTLVEQPLETGPRDQEGATVFKMTRTEAGSAYFRISVPVVAPEKYRVTFLVKKGPTGTLNRPSFWDQSGNTGSKQFNVSTGTTSGADNSYFDTHTITDLGDGWYKCQLMWMPHSSDDTLWFVCTASVGDVNDYMFVQAPSVVLAAQDEGFVVTDGATAVGPATQQALGYKVDKAVKNFNDWAFDMTQWNTAGIGQTVTSGYPDAFNSNLGFLVKANAAATSVYSVNYSPTSVISGEVTIADLYMSPVRGKPGKIKFAFGSGSHPDAGRAAGFDLATGESLGNDAGTTLDVKYYAKQDMYRLRLTATADTSTSFTMAFAVLAEGAVDYNDNEARLGIEEVIFRGMQMTKTYVADLIPTFGTEVTRAVDQTSDITIPSTDEGEVTVIYEGIPGITTGNSDYLLRAYGPTAPVDNNFVRIQRNRWRIGQGDSSPVIDKYSDIVTAAKTEVKTAFTCDATGNYKVFKDGVEIHADTLPGLKAPHLTTLNLAATYYFYPQILKRLRIMRKRLPDSKLIELTTLS